MRSGGGGAQNLEAPQSINLLNEMVGYEAFIRA